MEQKNAIASISAVILAGGNSRRMGTNKALLVWEEQTFLARIYKVLTDRFENIYVSGPKAWYEALGYHCIEDHYLQIGPLGALASIFESISTDWVFVVSCDTPFITSEILDGLLMESSKGSPQAVFYKVDGKQMPLVGWYHRSCLTAIKGQIASSNYRVMDFLNKISYHAIDAPATLAAQLKNINTRKELDEI